MYREYKDSVFIIDLGLYVSATNVKSCECFKNFLTFCEISLKFQVQNTVHILAVLSVKCILNIQIFKSL